MLDKKYNFAEKEKFWRDSWENNQTYKWEKGLPREDGYVIDTPPPTVSGQLHMGHMFSYCQADFIARFQRMIGKNVFYPIGFDDNGLPTERLVEKVKKVRANQMKREEFIEICHEVVQDSEEKFRDLFKTIALSVDWDQEYQTISSHSRKISQMSFLDLYNKGQLYQSDQPMLWDPVDHTALAQAEIEDKPQETFMNDIKFKLEDGSDIVIATTRPELLAACVCVFFNPEDERYKHLEGKFAITALFDLKVPLIADSEVDIEKGTGLVMCCTFGDNTDVLWWKKYKLPSRIVLNKHAKMQDISFEGASINPDKAVKIYSDLIGLKAKEARTRIIEILESEKLLVKQEKISNQVKCAERSGAVLEILNTPQWFIRSLEHKEILKKRSSEVNWYPAYMKVRLDNWIDNLNWDWCISRQRYFGVPIPVWYSKRKGEEGKILLPDIDQLPVDPLVDLPKAYSRDEVEPDQDVMDTWATSALTPQLSSHSVAKGYEINPERHQQIFPADLRPQAHEIIRTWAFSTILKAQLHEDSLPWKNIMISGWCLAEDKSKMSKSKGNTVTPENLLKNYGADIVRYWASTSKLGADTAYSEDVMKIGKKFVNKVWNASNFVSMQIDSLPLNQLNSDLQNIGLNKFLSKTIEDKTIYYNIDIDLLSKLNRVITESKKQFLQYEYCNARNIIEEFFWNDFCDNYLEIVKVRSYNEKGLNNEGQKSALYTLYIALNGLLRLFAPFIPYISEEIYQSIYSTKSDQSLHRMNMWPENFSDNCLQYNVNSANLLIETLDHIRKYKSEQQISLKTEIEFLEIEVSEEIYKHDLEDLQNVANVQEIKQVINPQSSIVKLIKLNKQ